MGQPHSALADTIKQLEDDADAHKRLARQNRDLASSKLKLAERLRAFCEENGITVKQQERDA